MVILIVVTGLMCLGVGSALLFFSDTSLKKSSPRVDYGLYGLAGILLAGMIANLLGWWIFAGLALLLAMLFTVILLPNVLIRNVYQ